MSTDENPLIKVNRPLALELGRLAEQMPYGSFARIGELCGFTREYVRQFFKGLHPISENNIKILDAANRLLDKGVALEEKAQRKVSELIHKTKP